MDALGNVFLIPSDGAFSVWGEGGSVEWKKYSVSSSEDDFPSFVASCSVPLWAREVVPPDASPGVTSQHKLCNAAEALVTAPQKANGVEDKDCALPEIESICLSQRANYGCLMPLDSLEGSESRLGWGGGKERPSPEAVGGAPGSPSALEGYDVFAKAKTAAPAWCEWGRPSGAASLGKARGAQASENRGRKGMTAAKARAKQSADLPALRLSGVTSSLETLQAQLIKQLHAKKYGRDSAHKLVLPKRNLICVDLVITGMCSNKATCNSAHSLEELDKKLELRKTSICKYWLTHRCKNEDCNFAHGEEELQSTDGVYKTTICKFWKLGQCDSGEMCRHAHGEGDLRPQNLPPHLEKKKQEQQTRRRQVEKKRVSDVIAQRRCISCGMPQREEPKTPEQEFGRLPGEKKGSEQRARKLSGERGRRRSRGGNACWGGKRFAGKDPDLSEQKRGEELSEMFDRAVFFLGQQ